jgi:hypothetical protein
VIAVPEEVMQTRRTPSRTAFGRGTRVQIASVLILVLVLIGVVVQRGSEQTEVGVLAAPDVAGPLQILLLGDSTAGEEGCPPCFTYSQQLAASVEPDDKAAHLHDHTWRPNASPAATVEGMIGYLTTNPDVRRAADEADIVVIAVGDSGGNRTYPDSLQRLLTLIDDLRDGRSAVLRLVTSSRLADEQCAVIAENGGSCVDLADLHVKGFRVGDRHASRGVVLTQHGHDVVGRELLRLGPI